MAKSISMKDIADMLGVNVSTVSRALKNDQSISADVIKSVRDTAERYKYRKPRKANNKFAYVIDERYFHLTSRFYNQVISGIQQTLAANNCTFELILVKSCDDVAVTARPYDFGGIIVTSSFHNDFVLDLDRFDIPYVLLDYYLPTDNGISVVVDNIDGIVLAVEHLVGLGHNSFLYLQGDVSDIGALDRLTGFSRGMTLHEIPDSQFRTLESGLSFSDSYEAVKAFLKNTDNKPPTAIIGVNDMVALGALQALRDLGFRVPEDISVVGFDGIDLVDEIVPHLTTMSVDQKLLGSLAVSELLTLWKGGQIKYNKLVIKPHLKIGQTTGTPSRNA